jgi:hypothetical protein
MASQAVHFTDKSAAMTETHSQSTVDARNPSEQVPNGVSHDVEVDLNTTAATPEDVAIPGVLFAIPFPPAVHAKHNDKRPSFLLYAPPRAAYRKPAPSPDGKPGKEKLVKRVERGWQEEVAQGVKIHDGDVPDASRWQRTKGALTRVRRSSHAYFVHLKWFASWQNAAKLIQWLPDSNIEALSRIPPKKKMHEVMLSEYCYICISNLSCHASRRLFLCQLVLEVAALYPLRYLQIWKASLLKRVRKPWREQ